ncbi:translation initiation factor [Marinomonas epiphytica]
MKKRNLVYSTELGTTCPECEQAVNECSCKQGQIIGDGNVKIRLDTKGRKGKGMTLVEGLAKTDKELKELAKKLKSLCGTGGSVKNGVIEIQGDNRQKIQGYLESIGIKSKLSGG